MTGVNLRPKDSVLAIWIVVVVVWLASALLILSSGAADFAFSDAVATALVGVAGIAGTLLTAREGRIQAERVLMAQLDHDTELVKSSRHQARIESAYIKLLDMAEGLGLWCQTALSDLYPNGPAQPPSADVQREVQAHIRAFASADVLEAVEDWTKIVLRMIAHFEADKVKGEVLGKHYVTFHDLRPKEVEARKHIGDVVRAELRDDPTG